MIDAPARHATPCHATPRRAAPCHNQRRAPTWFPWPARTRRPSRTSPSACGPLTWGMGWCPCATSRASPPRTCWPSASASCRPRCVGVHAHACVRALVGVRAHAHAWVSGQAVPACCRRRCAGVLVGAAGFGVGLRGNELAHARCT